MAGVTADALAAMTPEQHLRKVAALEVAAKGPGGGLDHERSMRGEAQVHIGMALIKLGLAAQQAAERGPS